ncbi:hypothetical protein BGZ94_008825, partial [Podila epigama]
MSKTKQWHPSRYLKNHATYRGQDHFALIILNQPIHIQRHLFENVWHNASFRFCADGGANQLYELMNNDEEREKYLPDYIRGDLDSLKDHVKAYYASKGVPIEKVDDEESTDLMKCVELVRARDPKSTTVPESESESTSTQKLDVVALGGTGGRFDQCMSAIHHLYVLNLERQATLISDESIVVVLNT